MTWEDVQGMSVAIALMLLVFIGVPWYRDRWKSLAQPKPKPKVDAYRLRQVTPSVAMRDRAIAPRKRRTIPAYRPRIPAAVHTNTTPPARDIIKTGPLTEPQAKVVRKLLEKGASANDLFTLLGGDRNTRLAEIREIRAELDNERLAAELAKLSTDKEPVPPMEPIPQAAGV